MVVIYTIPFLTLMLSQRDTCLQCMWETQHGFLARLLCTAYCWPVAVVIIVRMTLLLVTEMVAVRCIVKAMVTVMVNIDE